MEQVAYRAMATLAREDGYKFRIVTPRPFGPGRDRVFALDPEARDFPYRGRFGWRDFPDFRHHLSDVAAQCSHVWVTGTCAASLAGVRGLELPKVLSHHYHHFEGRGSWLRWRAFYDLLCRQLDAITYPTAFTRNEAVRIAPWLAGRATVVPNGYGVHYTDDADWDRKRTAARTRLGLEEGAFIIGNAGWLIQRKRFDVFLRTAALVREAIPNAQFIICGDGPLRTELEKLAGELGIADAVKWEGWVQDLTDYYRAWNILLFNSDFDTLPCAPMEAASYGCPTVASLTYGGLSEFIDHGQNGYIFSNHDCRALADAIIGLGRDETQMTRIRAAGQATLRGRFSEEEALKFYRTFFRDSAGTP